MTPTGPFPNLIDIKRLLFARGKNKYIWQVLRNYNVYEEIVKQLEALCKASNAGYSMDAR